MKRVWIYQSNRFFTADECNVVKEILQEFVKQWTAHGNQLTGSFEIKHNLFIILQVDEEQAMVTGCSIDKSVHLLKQIEHDLGVDLFDRMCIAYRSDGDKSIKLVDRNTFEQLLADGHVNDDTVVFNNMINTSVDLVDKWEVPMRESWHAQVFL